MADGYVRKLLNARDRLAVLQTMPIKTGDERRSVLADKRSDDGQLAYKHVPKAARISYFDFRVEALPSPYLKLFIENQATSTQFMSGRNFKTLRPLFYLPFLPDNTTRMKLAEPDDYDGPPVRFFTTAMIDGCSVYIEGPADTPKVTHSNARSVQPTQSTDTWLQKQAKIQAKIEAMNARQMHISKLTTTVIERPDYIDDDPLLVRLLKGNFARTKGVPPSHVMEYQPFGAVLGFKDDTTWSFWLQKCGRFEWKQRAEDTLRQYKITNWVIETRKIWPDGGGVFRLME